MTMAMDYVQLSAKQSLFAAEFWPGPLTIIATKIENSDVSANLTNNDKLAIRIPDNELIQKICTSLNKPIVATSANFSSKPNIISAKGILEEFADKVYGVVKEDEIKHQSNNLIPSTIVEFIDDDALKVVREGKIAKHDLNASFAERNRMRGSR